MQIGDAVIYVDPVGKEHDALLTAVHGTTWHRADGEEVLETVNVVYVSKDEAKRDPYGGQIERESSVIHQGGTQAHGRYWYVK